MNRQIKSIILVQCAGEETVVFFGEYCLSWLAFIGSEKQPAGFPQRFICSGRLSLFYPVPGL